MSSEPDSKSVRKHSLSSFQRSKNERIRTSPSKLMGKSSRHLYRRQRSHHRNRFYGPFLLTFNTNLIVTINSKLRKNNSTIPTHCTLGLERIINSTTAPGLRLHESWNHRITNAPMHFHFTAIQIVCKTLAPGRTICMAVHDSPAHDCGERGGGHARTIPQPQSINYI